jgi:arylsulfatase A-like enzyme
VSSTARRALVLSLLLAPACTRDAPSVLERQPDAVEPVALGCPRCNLIVLNTGNLRADHLGLLAGSLGHPDLGLTPMIDSFFADGIILEQASAPSGATYYSATSIATATEAMLNDHAMRSEDALMVPWLDQDHPEKWLEGGGRWLVLAALERDGELLVDHLPTIAQTLSHAGYHSAMVNDWIHTGGHVHLDRGFADQLDLTDLSQVGPKAPTSTVPVEAQVELVLAQLAAMRDEHPSQPAYLYFHTNALHFPYPHPDDPDRVVIKRDGAELFAAAYRKQLAALDHALGRVFSELEREGWLEDSVVLLYSNHGLALGEHGFVGMGRANQACVHTPVLLLHPALTEARRISAPVSLVDLAPTLYDLLDVPPLLDTQAHSMLPVLQSTGAYPRPAAFGRDIQEEFVRVGDWKLISGQSRSLYHLPTDPYEERDRLEEQPEKAAELSLTLERERARQRALGDELSAALEGLSAGGSQPAVP